MVTWRLVCLLTGRYVHRGKGGGGHYCGANTKIGNPGPARGPCWAVLLQCTGSSESVHSQDLFRRVCSPTHRTDSRSKVQFSLSTGEPRTSRSWRQLDSRGGILPGLQPRRVLLSRHGCWSSCSFQRDSDGSVWCEDPSAEASMSKAFTSGLQVKKGKRVIPLCQQAQCHSGSSLSWICETIHRRHRVKGSTGYMRI